MTIKHLLSPQRTLIVPFCLILLGIFLLSACGSEPETEVTLPVSFRNKGDSLSYALGVFYARDLEKNYISINQDIFQRGMSDEFAGEASALKNKEIGFLLADLRQDILQDLKERLADLPSANLREGLELYLMLKDSTGIVTRPDSLQYRVIQTVYGNTSPGVRDTVEIRYQGFKAGTDIPFEQTDTAAPARQVIVSDLIEGLQVAITLMHPGEQWEVFIPSELAYGKKGLGNLVEPNEMLIYNLELVAIRPGK